jgi:hypothetical protein
MCEVCEFDTTCRDCGRVLLDIETDWPGDGERCPECWEAMSEAMTEEVG